MPIFHFSRSKNNISEIPTAHPTRKVTWNTHQYEKGRGERGHCGIRAITLSGKSLLKPYFGAGSHFFYSYRNWLLKINMTVHPVVLTWVIRGYWKRKPCPKQLMSLAWLTWKQHPKDVLSLRSGLCSGQASAPKSDSVIHAFVDLALCTSVHSCLNRNGAYRPYSKDLTAI